MRHFRTVILHHTSRHGSHYDWLLEDPAQPGGLLWAARVIHASDAWLSMGAFTLQPIAPHRRRYLSYEGPISGGRGQVRRVDEGVFVPRLWCEHRTVLDVSLGRFEGRVEMRRVSAACWKASVQREVVPADDW